MRMHLMILLLFLAGQAVGVSVVPGDTVFPGDGGCRDSTYNRCINGGDLGAVCTPLEDGSHTCTCSTGYELYSDGICKASPDPCASSNWDNGNYVCSTFGDVPGTCVADPSTKTGYACSCPSGTYFGTSPFSGCFVDPCNSPFNSCNGGTCVNQNADSSTYGYPYTCTNCPAGTVFFDGTCQDTCSSATCSVCSIDVSRATGFTCTCGAGEVFYGYECLDPCTVDINGNNGNAYCAINDTAATCYPSAATPSYEECACSSGYKSIYDPAAELKTCVDQNECSETSQPCGSADPAAVCTNTVGSYTCSCSAGFENVGGVCTDINECGATTDPCKAVDSNAVCVNTVGSYVCNCPSGYVKVNGSCIADKGCSSLLVPCGEADPMAKCVDINGSYTCQCSSNFQFDIYQGKCVPKPVCTKKEDKNCKGKGKHGKGCKTKKQLGKGGHSGENSLENNSSEEKDGKDGCTCKPGFEYVDGVCQDINECLLSKSPCARRCKFGKVDTCENTIGGYRCTCRYGGFCDDGRKGKISKILKGRRQRCDCTIGGRFPYNYNW